MLFRSPKDEPKKKTTEEIIVPPEEAAVIAEMNKEFCVVKLGGKYRIATFTASFMYPGQFDLVYSTPEDFRFGLRNRKMAVTIRILDADGNQVGEKKKKISLVDFWLRNDNVRQYNNGIRFMPGSDEIETGDKDHRCLNMWEGFSIKSAPGDWSLFKAHVHDNLCSGNAEYADYLIRWMAFIVQFRKPTEVAVVLRGEKEGTGKTFFSKHFGHLFSRHAMLISNPEQILGKFNPHFETCLLVGAEEAIFSGDKRHRDAFWSLITGSTITIEPKGYTIYTVPSFLNFIVTTNHKLAVPVSASARRIFELEVGTAQMQNRGYFDKIEMQLKAGGYAAMLHELQNMDLREFEVTNCPKTTSLAASQALSRNGVDLLVETACSTARVPCAHWHHAYASVCSDTVAKRGLDYEIEHSTDRALSGLRALNVKKILAKYWGCQYGHPARQRDQAGDKLPCVQWPPLAALRADFVARHGPQDWMVPDADRWLGGDEPEAQGDFNDSLTNRGGR